MEDRRQKWTAEEEAALRAGVTKYGPGKWKEVLRDPNFRNGLASRPSVDLKDKWRNMSFSASGQGSRNSGRAHRHLLSPNLEIPHSLPFAQIVSEMQKAAKAAAYRITDAGNMYLLASEAAKEADKTAKMSQN